MEIKDFKDKFIYSIKVWIDKDNYLLLREPTILEMKGIKEKDNDEHILEIVKEILPACIVDHTLTNEGKKATNEEVVQILESSAFLYKEVVTTWFSQIPLAKRMKAK